MMSAHRTLFRACPRSDRGIADQSMTLVNLDTGSDTQPLLLRAIPAR